MNMDSPHVANSTFWCAIALNRTLFRLYSGQRCLSSFTTVLYSLCFNFTLSNYYFEYYFALLLWVIICHFYPLSCVFFIIITILMSLYCSDTVFDATSIVLLFLWYNRHSPIQMFISGQISRLRYALIDDFVILTVSSVSV